MNGVLAILVLLHHGMIVVPLDKALPDNEIEASVIRAEVDAIIFDKKYLKLFQNMKCRRDISLKHFICMDLKNDTDGILSLKNVMSFGKELIEAGNTIYDNVEIDENNMTIMLFTSGTTSLAKIVMLSQANICANIYSTGCIAKVTKEDTFLSFLPLHHTYESTTTFLYGLYSGITIAFCDGLRYVSQNLKEYKVTGFVCVPLILEAMYKKIKKGVKDKHLQIPFAILIEAGIEKKGKTKVIKIAKAISNFLLKFKIDVRRKFFKSIINELGRSFKTRYIWCCTNG